jgi:hypothetical protein
MNTDNEDLKQNHRSGSPMCDPAMIQLSKNQNKTLTKAQRKSKAFIRS